MRSLRTGLLSCLICLTNGLALQAETPLDVIKKGIAANGGKEKLEKFHAAEMTGKGVVDASGMKFEYTGHWQIHYPDRYRVEISAEINDVPFKIVQVVSGKEGWQKIADMETTPLPAPQLEGLRTQLRVDYASTLLPLLDTEKYKLSTTGAAEVKGKKALGVNVTDGDKLDVGFYFDPETYLLAKQDYASKDQLGKDVTQTVYFSDYKQRNGIPFPHKIEIQHDGQTFVTAEFTEVKLHEKLDADLFKKPE
jgi:outer membrane lipoprotein-sorting protein